jgi:maleylacetate reductase
MHTGKSSLRCGALVFSAIEKIVFGVPAAEALSGEAERLDARRVFVLASGTMSRTTDEVAKVRDALGTRYAGVYDHMPGATPRDAVLEAAALARDAGADLIATFGGGSLTDAGKMVQLCLRHDIREIDQFEAYRTVVNADGTRSVPAFEGPVVRQVAIPTTLSAAEFHAQASCIDPRTRAKQSYRHRLIVPRVVILDPAPTVHTPIEVWLSTGVRAIDHAAEGLCSQFSNPVSDASFLHALRLLSAALPKIKREPGDLEARLDCQHAIWLAMSGRQGGVQMGASHAIGHVLGGTCGVAHGYTSCIVLPHVMRYNESANASRQRLVSEAMAHPGEPAADVIAALVADLGLPSRLSQVDVSAERFDAVAARAMHEDWVHTNPRKISAVEQIVEILRAAA